MAVGAGPLILTAATSAKAPSIDDAAAVVVRSAFQGLRRDGARAGTSLTASATESPAGVILDEGGEFLVGFGGKDYLDPKTNQRQGQRRLAGKLALDDC